MKEDDGLRTIKRLDAWIDGDLPGVVPLELLEQRGVCLPDDLQLDDASLHDRLWMVIHAMAGLGMFVESTDHLSDRELYRHLVKVVLPEPSFLEPDDASFGTHVDIIGGFSEEDVRVYLTYYADEGERDSFRENFVGAFPKARTRPYDRDRLLPTQEKRFFGLADA